METRTKVRLVSAARQFYDGRQLRPGDKFEATAADAADLLVMSFAVKDPSNYVEVATERPRTLEAKVVDANDAEDESERQTLSLPRKGAYSRRDMRAKK